jgi:hypothetical protein
MQVLPLNLQDTHFVPASSLSQAFADADWVDLRWGSQIYVGSSPIGPGCSLSSIAMLVVTMLRSLHP